MNDLLTARQSCAERLCDKAGSHDFSYILHYAVIRCPLCLSFNRARKPKGKPKETKSSDERLGSKQRQKIKSKAFVSSSEDSSDSDAEKLKIADV